MQIIGWLSARSISEVILCFIILNTILGVIFFLSSSQARKQAEKDAQVERIYRDVVTLSVGRGVGWESFMLQFGALDLDNKQLGTLFDKLFSIPDYRFQASREDIRETGERAYLKSKKIEFGTTVN